MRLTEAYRRLGYDLSVPRQDWSAENATGVCLSVWRSETVPEEGLLVLDTERHSGPIADWRSKPGAKKREAHLLSAIEKHDRYIDVVINHGEPGEGGAASRVSDADPWDVERRGGRWRIASFDQDTGHFRLTVERSRPCPPSD